jgi:hypothetical protein
LLFLFHADPEGTLFFYNTDDLDETDTTTKYNLFHNGFTDNRRAITVQIYQDDPASPYAEVRRLFCSLSAFADPFD